MGKLRNDLTGITKGTYTVLHYKGCVRNRVMYRCVCNNCGTESDKTSSQLIMEHSRYCQHCPREFKLSQRKKRLDGLFTEGTKVEKQSKTDVTKSRMTQIMQRHKSEIFEALYELYRQHSKQDAVNFKFALMDMMKVLKQIRNEHKINTDLEAYEAKQNTFEHEVI